MSRQVVETLIARQLNQYNRLRSLLREDPSDQPVATGPVVTISRMSGCCARQLAADLGRELGVQVWGRELVDLIATDRGLRRELVSRLDQGETRDGEGWVHGVLSGRMFLKSDYVLALAQTLKAIADTGGGVIVGRGASFLLGERADLRVRLVAGPRYRLRTLMRERDLEKEPARERLEQLDTARREFVREYFRSDVNDPGNYDVVFNVEFIPADLQRRMCLDLIERRRQRVGTAEA